MNIQYTVVLYSSLYIIQIYDNWSQQNKLSHTTHLISLNNND